MEKQKVEPVEPSLEQEEWKRWQKDDEGKRRLVRIECWREKKCERREQVSSFLSLPKDRSGLVKRLLMRELVIKDFERLAIVYSQESRLP